MRFHKMVQSAAVCLVVTIVLAVAVPVRAQQPKDRQSLLKAAEQGDPKAQVELANIYLMEPDPDPDESLSWLKRAADQGDTTALFRIGQIYHQGMGIPRDYRLAADWFRKAAEKGHTTAQLNLGELYRTGTGVAQDRIQAYKWLSLAESESGADLTESPDRNFFPTVRKLEYLSATRSRKLVAGQMAYGELAEALRQVKEWKSAHPQTSAVNSRTGVNPSGAFQRMSPGNKTSPVVLYKPLPGYTDEARKAKVEGTILIECTIHKDGTVGDLVVLKGLGYGLDENAVNKIKNEWRFQPGTFNGEPIDVKTRIEVVYNLGRKR